MHHTSDERFAAACGALVQSLQQAYPAGRLVDYGAALCISDGLIDAGLAADGKRLLGFAEKLVEEKFAVGDFYEAEGLRLYWRLRLTSRGYSVMANILDEAASKSGAPAIDFTKLSGIL